MKLQGLKILFLLTFYLLGNSILPSHTYGQETTAKKSDDLVRITMYDGTFRTGYIISDDGREVFFNSKEVGTIYIKKNEIKSITKIEESEIGESEISSKYDPVNPPASFNTRYHFTTNALPLKKNENYIAINLYGPEVHFSPIDNLSVGVMTSWVATPIVLALKYTIPTNNKKLNFGIGSLFGTSGYLNAFENIGGLSWAMVTFGDADLSLTLSGGISYFDIDGVANNDATIEPKLGTYFFPTGTPVNIPDEFAKTKALIAPAFSIGFAARVSRTATFILDGMLFTSNRKNISRSVDFVYSPGGTTVNVVGIDKKSQLLYLMPGMRFQSRPNFAFQFSLAGVSIFNKQDQNQSFPIPMATWFLRF